MSIPGDGLNGLPSELICLIFRLTIDPDEARDHRCRLMLVCRQWREYVEGSALLWTDIFASHGPLHVRRALEKSRGAMVDIDYQVSSKFAMRLEAFMVEVGPHIGRWRSLILRVPESTPHPEIALALLKTAQPPGLEVLSLENRSYYTEFETPVTLFSGAPPPPSLKHLALLRIPIAVEPLRLSGLVSLNLSDLPTISTPQLLEILRASPGLETLSLVGNLGLVAIESQESNLQPIELAKLVSIFLGWMHNCGTNYILSNIRFPNRRRVTVGADISEVSARSVLLTPSIAHLLHKVIPASNTPSSVITVMEYGHLDFMITFHDLEFDLTMDREGRIHEVLGWFADGLGSQAAECPVHLILTCPAATSADLAEVPPPFAIKHLSISNQGLSTSSWEALYTAMTRVPNPTSSGWLLPQLESLSVEFDTEESPKQLVSMLRSRYEGATSTGETESRCPMNLRSVKLGGEPKEEGLVEEIRGIIGEVNVFWGER